MVGWASVPEFMAGRYAGLSITLRKRLFKRGYVYQVCAAVLDRCFIDALVAKPNVAPVNANQGVGRFIRIDKRMSYTYPPVNIPAY